MAKETISFDYKNKNGYITCSNPNTFRVIREKFSIPTPNFKRKLYHLRKYVITPIGAFQIGLFHEIYNFILSLNLDIAFKVSNEFKKVIRPDMSDIKLLDIDGFTYYDYQKEALETFIKKGRGISLIATSGGKSLVIAGLCKSIHAARPNARILVIVPDISLLEQLYNSFTTEFNLPIIERWGNGNIPSFEYPVLVANMQILSSDLHYTIQSLKDYDFVIIDEVHRLGDKEKAKKNKKGESTIEHQLSKIVHNIETPHKFGLTGTLPDNISACWNILGKIGHVVYVRTSHQVRSQGTAAEVFINVVYCEHSEKVPPPEDIEIIDPKTGDITYVENTNPTAKYDAERKFLIRSQKRNDVIRKISHKLTGNILILVDSIEYGETLEELLKHDDKVVYFVRGSTDTDERADIIRHMEIESNIICVAMSKIFSTGISINNLHHVIFTGIGKSTVKIMQSIGRSMRLHESKDLAKIYDICDNTEYSHKHILKRIDLYTREKIKFKTKKVKL